MSIIEQAAKRLEELQRAGVQVPWSAAGLSEAEIALLDKSAGQTQGLMTPPEGFAPHALPTLSHALLKQNVQTAQAQSVVEFKPQHFIELDLQELIRLGYALPEAPRSALIDQFRSIKRPILNHAREQHDQPSPMVPNGGTGTKRQDAELARQRANLVMVTSAMPGEGKTFCALNLALSIASEVDTSVLLVDSDVVRPCLLSRLGLKGNLEYKGLLELLEDRSFELSDAVLGTNLPKLCVLPAGRPRGHSTELLASSGMETLLNQLCAQDPNRIVIFDTPPLLATTESQVLATRMGQILMVVDETRSQPDDVAKAFALLESCPVVMSVLNKSLLQREASRYGYGYEKN
jgi:protein-tyrosine kinase